MALTKISSSLIGQGAITANSISDASITPDKLHTSVAQEGLHANSSGLRINANTGVTANSLGLFIGQDVATTANVIFNTVTANVVGTVTGTVSDISNHDTDSLSEGATNLYFTNARVPGALSNGTGVSVYSNGNIAIDQSVATTANVTFNTVTANVVGTITGTVSSLSNHDTDDLSEGVTNLYFSNARAIGALSNGTGVSINSTGYVAIGQAVATTSNVTFNVVTADVTGNVTGTVSSLSNHDTDDLSEGATNLYFTNARVPAALSNGTGVSVYSNGNIAIGQSVGTTDSVTFANVVTTDITISGNLVVSGTTTTIDSINLSVNDSIITLASGQSGTPALDAGLEVERGTSANVYIKWNETNDKWTFTNDGSTYANIATSTTELAEGTNLYYTTARANTDIDARVTKSLVDALAITQVGTISSGTWQGTAIASAYLDSDTAHLSETQTFTGTKSFTSPLTTRLITMDIPDSGGSPATTAILRLKGYDGRGAGIKIQDNVNSSTGASDREWFIGTGYNQSGFNIGYAANGYQSSYTSQSKFSLDTSGNASFAGNIAVDAGYGLVWSGDATRIVTPEDNSVGGLFKVASGAATRFMRSTSESMRIDGSGKLGVGTQTPYGRVDISKDGNEALEIFPGASANVNTIQHYNRTGSNYVRSRNIASDFTFNLSGAASDALVLTTDGRLSLGNSSPTDPFTVSAASHNLVVQHRQSNGLGVGQEFLLQFNDSAGGPVSYGSVYAAISNNTTTSHSGDIALRIAESGSLTSKLYINSSSTSFANNHIKDFVINSYDTNKIIPGGSTNWSGFTFKDDDTTTDAGYFLIRTSSLGNYPEYPAGGITLISDRAPLTLSARGDQALDGANSKAIHFNTNNAIRMVLDSAGRLGIGTPTFANSQASAYLHIRGAASTGNAAPDPYTYTIIEQGSSNGYIEFIGTSNQGQEQGLLFTDNTSRAGYVKYINYNGNFDVSDSLYLGAFSRIFFQTSPLTGGMVTRAYFSENGHLIPGADATYDMGSSSVRWRNIYTSDLSLKNEHGDWTIVEGEDELFLYNNKKGKTYKFMLQEVDPATVPAKKE